MRIIIKPSGPKSQSARGVELTLPASKPEMIDALDQAKIPYGSGEYLLEDEENEAIRAQLEQDILLLDSEQTSMATAREFFLVLHLRGDNTLEIQPYLSHIEQIVREQGFTVNRAGQEDVMRVLAMYFEQNVTSDRLEAFDGERFVAV